MSRKREKLKSGLSNLFSSPPPQPVPATVEDAPPPAAPIESPPPAPPAEHVPPLEPKPAQPPKAVRAAVTAPEVDGFDDDETQLVVFKLGDEFYGVDISIVESIINPQQITLVPHAHPYVEGVTNLRGTVVPVIDLRTRFGMPRAEISKNTRIVVVEHQNSMIGLVVDAVSEVLRISPRVIEPPSAFVAGTDSAFISGIAKLEDRLITLLDLGKVFAVQDAAEKRLS